MLFCSMEKHPPPSLPDWISHSWRRCLDNGLHPDHSVEFDAVSAGHITRTLEQQREFVQAAQPEIERLCRAIAGTSFFALLTDAKGVVLYVGQPQPSRQAGGSHCASWCGFV
jgi:transcriptional regulator of acetoin/glycerol metabolism